MQFAESLASQICMNASVCVYLYTKLHFLLGHQNLFVTIATCSCRVAEAHKKLNILLKTRNIMTRIKKHVVK